MTKKRSLLLTGLFAVSGILPCHAEYFFFRYLPARPDRIPLFNDIGKTIKNPRNPDKSWPDSVQKKYATEYIPALDQFQGSIRTVNIKASAATRTEVNLPENGHKLYEVRRKAEDIEEQALSGQTIESLQQDIKALNDFYTVIQQQIALITQHKIDISHLFGAHKQSSNKKQTKAVNNKAKIQRRGTQRY